MRRPEPPDVTNQPDRANIERIVEYLGQLSDGVFGLVPGDVLDALTGLLVRAEVAERQLARKEQEGEAEQRGEERKSAAETERNQLRMSYLWSERGERAAGRSVSAECVHGRVVSTRGTATGCS